MSETDSIIGAESGGDPNAKNSRSSASGLGQFIDATWLDTVKKHRPDLAGLPNDQILALKNDPVLSREMTGAHASDNHAILSKNGLPVTPGTTYLAHFAGPQGAVKVLQADPNAPVESILGASAVQANPFLKGMTAGGLQAWAAKKMGASPPTAGAQPQQPQPAPQPPLPTRAIPPQQQPIFAQGPQAQSPQASAPSQFVPPTQAIPQQPMQQPLFAEQQPPIDLSRLRAALAARAQLFRRG